MATFKSFEEIGAWKAARVMSKKIHRVCQEGSFSRDYKLKDQINGASGSVMDNIAEGFERSGNREFIQFLAIAKGSVGEVRSQLFRALDRHHFSEQTFNELYHDATEISKLLSSLMNYLRHSDFRGTKFH